ncbi:MAG: crotonase/enoyl-CoA hydratase family protein [Hyphomicrobiaceae bacterium]|nr:crotonase/enoyl-CoA hydratase family protein [Hyphomicrobiaceae bacterium]
MSPTDIRCEIADKVLTITLDRPDKLNALTRAMRNSLVDAFDAADRDDDVRAVIVTGAGRAFCAGADLSGGAGTFDYSRSDELRPDGIRRDGGGQIALKVFNCTKPVIGAINGAAVGFGATFTLPMDIRLASEQARFGFVFSRRGVVPEACSSWFLPRIVDISQALAWTMSGRVFPATEALAGGLVSEVLPPDDLLPRAHEIAREIADNTSAVSVAMIRQMMWRMLGADHPMIAHRIDSRGLQQMGAAADAREGVASFIEKRAPQFAMRPSADMPPVYPWWEEPEFE